MQSGGLGRGWNLLCCGFPSAVLCSTQSSAWGFGACGSCVAQAGPCPMSRRLQTCAARLLLFRSSWLSVPVLRTRPHLSAQGLLPVVLGLRCSARQEPWSPACKARSPTALRPWGLSSGLPGFGEELFPGCSLGRVRAQGQALARSCVPEVSGCWGPPSGALLATLLSSLLWKPLLSVFSAGSASPGVSQSGHGMRDPPFLTQGSPKLAVQGEGLRMRCSSGPAVLGIPGSCLRVPGVKPGSLHPSSHPPSSVTVAAAAGVGVHCRSPVVLVTPEAEPLLCCFASPR